MTRQLALNQIWSRLMIIFLALGLLSIMIAYFGAGTRVPALVFLFGNIGAYVGVHRSLATLQDSEINGLADSWLGLIVPSFVGGILAFVIYLLFLSNIISGDLFPHFTADQNAPAQPSFDILAYQHADTAADYAKLMFWSFLAGFNQKYAVDIIDSIRAK